MRLKVEDMPAPTSNRCFWKGDRVVITDLSGIDSRETAVIVAPFDWKLEEGAYKPPSKAEVPIRVESTGALRYMYKGRLIHLTYRGKDIN